MASIFPDFFICDEVYGSNLDTQDCLNTINQLPRGSADVTWLTGASGPYNLPLQKHSGSVYVTVETTGNSLPPVIVESPETIYRMASVVCERCVGRLGKGGFTTDGIMNSVNWAITNAPPMAWSSLPPVTASFLTVTISGSRRKFAPGNTDPLIPTSFARIAQRAREGESGPIDSILSQVMQVEQYWIRIGEGMQRGSSKTWWQAISPSTPDDMTYQCDAKLGSPATVDCTQIEWNQLGSPSDSLSIGPEVTFFHSNACYLAISAAVVTVVNWNQIRTAVGALINVCIQNPYQAAQGGSAFYSPQPAQVSGRKKKEKKRRDVDITGLNALPPGLKLFMFEQTEAWTNPTDEIKTCAWQAVLNGGSVTSCK